MADHTYCYTPAVLKIRELIADGFLGDILFVDSVRINLGLIQPDVDVFWDLAPHDLSIMDFILPGGLDVTSVSAHGADPLGTGKSCVGYLAMPLAGGGDRPRARQLAEPDQDPSDGDRRHQAHARLGRPQPAAARQRLRPRRRPRAAVEGDRRRARVEHLVPARRHLGTGAPRARGAGRRRQRVRRIHPREARSAHERRIGAARPLGARGGRRKPRRRTVRRTRRSAPRSRKTSAS